MIKKSLLILALTFSFAFAAKADVAPEFGYSRVNFDLVIDAKGDLSDYDFELDFNGDRRKVLLNNNSRTTIPPSNYGGGARYSSAVLYAIPKNTEANLSGQIKLFTHYFRRDVTFFEKLTASPPVYLIEKDGATLKAVKSGDDNSYGFLIAAIFLSLSVLILGILLFRKMSKKSKINV